MTFFLILFLIPNLIFSVGLQALLVGPNAIQPDEEGVLDLSSRRLKTIKGIDRLVDRRVKAINLDDNEISDLSPLENMELELISLATNKIKDARPLLKMRGLKRVLIEGNLLSYESIKAFMMDPRQLLKLGELDIKVDDSEVIGLVEFFKPSIDLRKELREKKSECVICHTEDDPANPLFFTICFHIFHTDCLNKWMKKAATCPVCRNQIRRDLAQ